MATATPRKTFASDLSESGLFGIVMIPNRPRDGADSVGEVWVGLKLCALPNGVQSMKIKYKLKVPALEGKVSGTETFSYDHPEFGGKVGLFQTFKAVAASSMRVIAEVEILSVYQDAHGTMPKNAVFKQQGVFHGVFCVFTFC